MNVEQRQFETPITVYPEQFVVQCPDRLYSVFQLPLCPLDHFVRLRSDRRQDRQHHHSLIDRLHDFTEIVNLESTRSVGCPSMNGWTGRDIPGNTASSRPGHNWSDGEREGLLLMAQRMRFRYNESEESLGNELSMSRHFLLHRHCGTIYRSNLDSSHCARALR